MKEVPDQNWNNLSNKTKRNFDKTQSISIWLHTDTKHTTEERKKDKCTI